MAAPNPLDLDITVVSAKHLKNVNWRSGDLKPYVVLYLEPDNRLSTHSDDSGSTKPVWNERITIPMTRTVHESVLTVEIFHSKASDPLKALVGSVRFPLVHLVDSDESLLPDSVHALELVRPSGRPQGKIRLKLAIKERPSAPPPPPPRPQSQPQDCYPAPQGSYYFSSAPPPPPAPIMASSPSRDYREFSPSPYPYDHYYPGYYYAPPPPPSRPIYDRASNYGLPGGPSAPLDSFPSNDHKPPPPPSPLVSRLSSYGPPSGPSAPVDAFSSNDHKPPPPSPLVSRLSSYGPDAFPSNDHKPPPPPASVTSRLSNYGMPSGPSAPVDYSPYDHNQLQKRVGGLSLEEERSTADRAESELATRASYGYGSNYRHEC